ncbi:MAG: DUF58 domain-containing protein [Clostridia bacterium]|nr:DUF58 domain-containing protein [Clostridia bacterium]
MKISYLSDKFFNRLETLALNLRTDLTGYFGGKHLVSTYGQTVEFADYREYQFGDDIRRIDWNLFSRFEKYFLKLFTDERQMQVQIFLDCSASMGKDNPQKSAYAVAVAAALGFLSVHNMDKVSFNFMRGTRSENPYGTLVGKQAFFRAVGGLDELTFDDEVDIRKCVQNCPDTSSGNGLSVIISDFFTDDGWKKAVDYLRYKRRQVLLVQILTPDEDDPLYDGRVNLIDSEAADVLDERNMKLKITRGLQHAYQDALRDFKQSIREFCVKREADYITIRTDSRIEQVIFGELLKVGIIG